MQRLSSLSEAICPGRGKVRFGCRNGIDAIGDHAASPPEAGLTVKLLREMEPWRWEAGDKGIGSTSVSSALY